MTAALLQLRSIFFLLAGLSIVVAGYSRAEPRVPFSKALNVAKSQSQRWSPSVFLTEPEDVEEEGEEVDESDVLLLFSASPNLVFLNSSSFTKINFLSAYSGRLQFLNIPPPSLSSIS